MYYALNMWNYRGDDPEPYRDYLRTAAPCLDDVGGALVCIGRLIEPFPQKFENSSKGGGQRWMNITSYETFDGPKRLYEHPTYQTVAPLRDTGTTDYVWAYYEEADVLTEP
jgi:uncharacterized protein (DUF1330 family)